jgi:hypothetical protein
LNKRHDARGGGDWQAVQVRRVASNVLDGLARQLDEIDGRTDCRPSRKAAGHCLGSCGWARLRIQTKPPLLREAAAIEKGAAEFKVAANISRLPAALYQANRLVRSCSA